MAQDGVRPQVRIGDLVRYYLRLGALGFGGPVALVGRDLGDGKAAIAGDFVLIASEVNPVARTLRANGIEVTALHNHALGDGPRLFYMHFWAHDDALKLARGLRAALDLTNSRKQAARHSLSGA